MFGLIYRQRISKNVKDNPCYRLKEDRLEHKQSIYILVYMHTDYIYFVPQRGSQLNARINTLCCMIDILEHYIHTAVNRKTNFLILGNISILHDTEVHN